MSENMPSLAPIRVQKEDPVNPQRSVRDFRGFLEKSRPIRRQSGRLSVWALIAAKDSSIFPHFRLSDIGVEMGPKIGYP